MTSPHESDRAAKPLPTDMPEVGMSTRLGLSLPLLTVLVQCVAETEADWSFLNVTTPSGAWIGAARRAGEDQLTISTNQGEAASEPYADERHPQLVAHGFGHVPEDKSYTRVASFETDEAFLATARLMVGTLQHVYGADLRDILSVQLSLEP
jgi:hypothetical protein